MTGASVEHLIRPLSAARFLRRGSSASISQNSRAAAGPGPSDIAIWSDRVTVVKSQPASNFGADVRASSPDYVTDVPYVTTFTPYLAPAWLDFVALLGGQAPPGRQGGFAWCELGCGQGVTAAILAATHPEGAFYGIDLMPNHISNGEFLASRAGIANLTLHCGDFATAATLELPTFNYIVAHGVYSWVSDAQQADLRRFINSHLAPGGLVYISYNALPGWAAELPFAHLLRALAATASGDSISRFATANSIITRLGVAGAQELAASLGAATLGRLRQSYSAGYLAHEYLAPHAQPLYVTEVRRDMAEIGLKALGSATFLENFDSFMLRQAERQALDEIEDADLRALARDYVLAQRFRRDVFSRDGRPLDEREVRRAMLDGVFMLARPAEDVRYVWPTPAGSLHFDNPVTRGIAAALSERPRRLGDIPLGRTMLRDRIAGAIGLIAGGAIIPVGPSSAPVARLNAALREALIGDPPSPMLALPCGTALPVPPELLRHLFDGADLPISLIPYAAFLTRIFPQGFEPTTAE
jgi:SAM-dependent methyltransferase